MIHSVVGALKRQFQKTVLRKGRSFAINPREIGRAAADHP